MANRMLYTNTTVHVELHAPATPGIVVDEPLARVPVRTVVLDDTVTGVDGDGGREYTAKAHLFHRDDLVPGDRHRRELALARSEAERRARERADALARTREATAHMHYGEFLLHTQRSRDEYRWLAMCVLADWLQEQRADDLALAFRWAASRELFPLPWRGDWYWMGDGSTNQEGKFPEPVRDLLQHRAGSPTLGVAFDKLSETLAELRRATEPMPRD